MKEASDKNPDNLQIEGFYFSLVVDPTDYVGPGGVISIICASEYSPLNKNNYDVTVIDYLDSNFECFDYHDTPVTLNTFNKFLDACVSPFYSVEVNFESTTVAVDTHDIHFPSRYTIACFE